MSSFLMKWDISSEMTFGYANKTFNHSRMISFESSDRILLGFMGNLEIVQTRIILWIFGLKY